MRQTTNFDPPNPGTEIQLEWVWVSHICSCWAVDVSPTFASGVGNLVSFLLLLNYQVSPTQVVIFTEKKKKTTLNQMRNTPHLKIGIMDQKDSTQNNNNRNNNKKKKIWVWNHLLTKLIIRFRFRPTFWVHIRIPMCILELKSNNISYIVPKITIGVALSEPNGWVCTVVK